MCTEKTMRFGDLKRILNNSRGIVLYDEDDNKIVRYGSCYMDNEYDDFDVYMVDIRDGDFRINVNLPTWRVTGTITVDIEFTVKAIDEETAFEMADSISAESSYDSINIRQRNSDIDVSLGVPDFEWDDAEIYD